MDRYMLLRPAVAQPPVSAQQCGSGNVAQTSALNIVKYPLMELAEYFALSMHHWSGCSHQLKIAVLEEKSFIILSSSFASDTEFYYVVGFLEDIIMDDEFQLLHGNFMDKYYKKFKDREENKVTYTPILNEYIYTVERYIEEQLWVSIAGVNMGAFTTFQHHKDEVVGDIFDMLLKFINCLAFKEMFLDYRAEKGWGMALSSGLVVTSLCKSSSTSVSKNNLHHQVPPPDNEIILDIADPVYWERLQLMNKSWK
ncbi:ADP-ribosylation factor-like protein 2-binding protein [Saccopteryx bilineata]|uniref:ADP-ribosylation factor-like protein 2-binding protein n=1 Tax=Saccopteryx bilineata TaxID=59482 RepID=UPI00338D57FF